MDDGGVSLIIIMSAAIQPVEEEKGGMFLPYSEKGNPWTRPFVWSLVMLAGFLLGLVLIYG